MTVGVAGTIRRVAGGSSTGFVVPVWNPHVPERKLFLRRTGWWCLMVAAAWTSPAAECVPVAVPEGAVELPPTLVQDPLGMPIVPPAGLGRWLEVSRGGGEEIVPPALETVAKPLEEFVKTPWKAPAFAAPTRPGLLVRQESRLPWGIDAEWRVGVAVDSKGPGKGEFTDASQWTIRKSLADDFLVYLHDRGSGFVKSFGQRMSVFGRYVTSGDKSNPVSTVQVGAATSY
jgi:hypothetical protein